MLLLLPKNNETLLISSFYSFPLINKISAASNNVLATSKSKHFLFSFVGHCTLPTVNAFVTKNMSILNIDDYCLEVTPRDNKKVRYLYGFGNKNSKLLF